MRKFVERQTSPKETQCLLLSPNLSDANDLTLQTQENFFADDKLKFTDKNLREFGIDDMTEDAALTLNFTYKPPIGALSLNAFELRPDIKIFAHAGDEWHPFAADSAEFNLTSIDGNTFAVQFKIAPEDLRDGYINFVYAALVPTDDGCQLPEWIGKWNMANVDADPRNFDGSKTANLLRMMTSLKDLNSAATRPALVRLDFVVDLR